MRLAEDPTGVILTGAELGLGLVVWNAVWALVATRTPGEWVARLEVIDATGLRAGRLRLLVRALAYASWGVSLGFAAGLPWVSRTHRGLPDLAARTWVVAVD